MRHKEIKTDEVWVIYAYPETPEEREWLEAVQAAKEHATEMIRRHCLDQSESQD